MPHPPHSRASPFLSPSLSLSLSLSLYRDRRGKANPTPPRARTRAPAGQGGVLDFPLGAMPLGGSAVQALQRTSPLAVV